VITDANAANPGVVAGDVTVLELIWQRASHKVDASKAKDVVAQLSALRAAADAQALSTASSAALALRAICSSGWAAPADQKRTPSFGTWRWLFAVSPVAPFRRTAPGEVPIKRLKARLKAASDR